MSHVLSCLTCPQILIAPADENTSADAKRHAKEVLSAAGYQVEKPSDSTDEEHETRVMAGYKAALASMWHVFQRHQPNTSTSDLDPNVSEAAKQHAMDLLKEHGAL